MRNSILAFGAVVGIALVAVPVVGVGVAALDVIREAVHPSLYQLTFELDGQYYIADYNLSRSDCYAAVEATRNDPDSLRNGQGRYTCDRSPMLVAAK